MRTNLRNIEAALKGDTTLTPDLEDDCKALIGNKVPGQWLRRSYLSLKSLGNYVNDLLARLDFFREWIDRGEPIVYRISYFYYPQLLVNAIKLQYSRCMSSPIEEVVCDFQVTEYETNPGYQTPIMGAIFIQVMLSITYLYVIKYMLLLFLIYNY